ncbi:MAG: hypothetical protein JJT77_13190 [Crocinitomicaceae bacterium]|nr:hypothetical protein [Crocinitomicaceae bacterium]
MKFKALIVLFFIVLFLFGIDLELFAQCSQCKLLSEQHAQDDEILGVANKANINTAILYIMTVPYIILSFVFRKQILRFVRNRFRFEKV